MSSFISKRLFILVFLLTLFVVHSAIAASVIQLEPEAIKFSPVGVQVKTRGIVIATPGQLGKQFFYINGIQIYSYHQDFPELKLGDKIEIRGEISQNRGEKRVKIKSKDNIRVLDRGLKVDSISVSLSEIKTDLVGKLIQITSQVIEKTGNKIFIGQKEDKEEAIIYLTDYADIDKSCIEPKNKIEITGILRQYNDELRIFPRSNQDIKVVPKMELESKDNSKIVLLSGETKSIKTGAIQHRLLSMVTALGFILLIVLYLKSKFCKNRE